jgi:hypothetical protein
MGKDSTLTEVENSALPKKSQLVAKALKKERKTDIIWRLEMRLELEKIIEAQQMIAPQRIQEIEKIKKWKRARGSEFAEFAKQLASAGDLGDHEPCIKQTRKVHKKHLGKT